MLSRKNSQRSQQQRQLESETETTSTTTSSHSNHQYEKESNAAFERICTLLTDLITDASTAVSTADRTHSMDLSGTAVVPSIVIPRYLPMVCSESDNSDEEVEASYLEGGEAMMPLEDDGFDGQASVLFDEEANLPPESPRDQIRRRIDDSRKKRLARNRTGSYTADPSKRTSLFLELQNLQLESDSTQHPTTPVLGNLVTVDPEELQWVIQRVDAELDRTVETIDDLTRDLMAVATHQNWMKAHLERTLGIQSPLSLADILQKNDDGVFFQVAGAAAGETGAIPMSPTSSTSPRSRFEQMEDIIGATKALLSSKEFANYYQVLERVRIMEQEDDCEEDYHRGGQSTVDRME
ncbi:hypothetical protein BGZ96_006791 [Linnemannia gamsii]|uniref:Uncharacterized protein n=1 Tax=Linnemannia gamsii TaxID=64522 RepID=A0ABQ7K1U2_9FUNG|nr:hypothetical protein BGZ96_006791 [Linnemannia gamsii]